MIRKSVKVKRVEGRTELVEFIVGKRVRYLEYLNLLHSDKGALWMNCVLLNREIIGRCYSVPEEVLQCRHGAGIGEAVNGSNQPVFFPLEQQQQSRRFYGDSVTSIDSSDRGDPAASTADAPRTPTGSDTDCARLATTHLPAPFVLPEGKTSPWIRKYLPCLCVLAASLADLLVLPLGGIDFVECLYGLLLELDVAFSRGPAAKTLAQRNLKNFRLNSRLSFTTEAQDSAGSTGDVALEQILPPSLGSPLPAHSPFSAAGGSAGGGAESTGDIAAATAPAPSPAASSSARSSSSFVKYHFLNKTISEYVATPPCYDAVLPSLISILIFTYRRLCDYELMADEDATRRIVSIDRRLQELVLHRVGVVLEKVARDQLIRQASALSLKGLFAGLEDGAGGGGEAGEYNFVDEIVRAQQTVAAPSQAGVAAAGSTTGAGLTARSSASGGGLLRTESVSGGSAHGEEYDFVYDDVDDDDRLAMDFGSEDEDNVF